jgi:hypothetical protein
MWQLGQWDSGRAIPFLRIYMFPVLGIGSLQCGGRAPLNFHLVLRQNCKKFRCKFINPILHIAWLNNHALTLKRNTAKYYFGEKSSLLHTFLKICCESRKI